MSGRFLCVGDMGVDLFLSVNRLPGSDDKVPARRLAEGVGGMAANVAVGLRRLGSAVRLVAAVGDDEPGARAERILRKEGIDLGFLVRRGGESTLFCVVLVGPEGEKSLIRVETGAYLPAPSEVADAALAGIRHVHLTFGSEALTRHCVARARSLGATLSLDLELADLPADPAGLTGLLPQFDWLFLSRRTRSELERRLGPSVLAPVPGVITTDGARGCRLERGGRREQVAGHAVPVADTTGAGDALAAAFLHFHLDAGLSELAALRRASAAAALVIGQPGAQTGLPQPAEVDRFLRSREAAVPAPPAGDA